ncbi:M15 family metallopeptidase [Streptomyces sp. NPDC058195]|uniref:M15 family metallopeptidase n=1 Tax=Streptomyces sp. NPDC058195 TaxID=3346375 RepID=UPI0036E32B2C
MHDDPTTHRLTGTARRFPVRTAVGAGAAAAAVVVLAVVWGTATPRNAPPAPAAATADHRTGGTDVPPDRALAPSGTRSADVPPDRALTPSDTRYPAVGRLDERLLEAVQRAARDARQDGVVFQITSGWRSGEHQQRLLDEAIEKYGSAEAARQYVNTPRKSAHVSGKAVDIGPTDADDWLIQHGSDYGLCQVYTNEMWHFELLTSPGGDCPAQLRNAAG